MSSGKCSCDDDQRLICVLFVAQVCQEHSTFVSLTQVFRAQSIDFIENKQSLKYFVVLNFSEGCYDSLFLFADIASSCREDNKSNEIFYLCIFSAA